MSLRVHFFMSDKQREHLLADAVLRGAERCGYQVSSCSIGKTPKAENYDVACFVGVKSRELFREHNSRGTHVIYFDKGYSRHKSTRAVGGWEYWRVSVDSHHPTRFIEQMSMPSDRFDALSLEVKPWRTEGKHILIAGSSAKYHAFYGLKDPTTFGKDIVRDLRAISERPLWYRPKPSWREAVPLLKTRYSVPPETITDALCNCWAMVTHGSNACFEALIGGIPSIVLGDAITRPISSSALNDVESPRLASDDERAKILANLAYCQWTLPEMASGKAWDTIGGMIHGTF